MGIPVTDNGRGEGHRPLPADWLLLDLETASDGSRIAQIGAVLGADQFHRAGNCETPDVLAALDRFAGKARCVVGHNVLQHDLSILTRVAPELKLLQLPIVDTLHLSPICFPENPYHRLVKDYKLVSATKNDPVADCQLAGALLLDEIRSLQGIHQNDPLAFAILHGLLCGGVCHDGGSGRGAELVMATVGVANPSGDAEVLAGLRSYLGTRACRSAAQSLQDADISTPEARWVLAYVLTWLRVAGGASVLPPWIRAQHRDVAAKLMALRDVSCDSPECEYCRLTHNPETQLNKFFRFSEFRATPADAQGGSLQRAITLAGMRNQSLLAIMPTGGGKSICFQLPALVRHVRRGQITVVISPLQALMKDQVDGLVRRTGQNNCAALYGLLTSPERADVLRRIRMGDLAILYVSPEQLRSNAFTDAIAQREIGCWVMDEAHCLSKWGHDFRPDYLYVGRYIREMAQRQDCGVPPIACFTATAKKDVIAEIVEYFRRETGSELARYEGGVERDNLSFQVQTVGSHGKLARIDELLHEHLDGHVKAGSAVVFRSVRKSVEETAEFLKRQGWIVEHFHAGLLPPEKKRIQDAFLNGDIRVICATNAFGMGVDKDDVRVVIHGDTPGSLENYLQEAGRAGRDRAPAECVLLYDEEDCEKQFKLGALSELSRKDIAGILRGLRVMDRKRQNEGELVLTTGELIRNEAVDTDIMGDDRGVDTKVRAAISWLERAGFLERNENKTNVIQAKVLVQAEDEVDARLAKLNLSRQEAALWKALLGVLQQADPSDMVSVDQISALPEFQAYAAGGPKGTYQGRLSQEALNGKAFKVMSDMTRAGLLKNDTLLTAFIRFKVADHSGVRLGRVLDVDRALLALMSEEAPDPEGWLTLNVRLVNQALLDRHCESSPDLIRHLLKSLSEDGRGFAGQVGSIELRFIEHDLCRIRVKRDWNKIVELAELRRRVANMMLDSLLSWVPDGMPAQMDLKVEFAYDDLIKEIESDPTLRAGLRDSNAAVERGLMFMHETEVLTLQRGLAVFRSAMTIRLLPEAGNQRYSATHFEVLRNHYQERIFQVHVMNEYARYGLAKIQDALQLVVSYFTMDKEAFIRRYFNAGRELLTQATTARSYRRIVDELANKNQQRIVLADSRRNLLILAGPGSGKTRTLVHRCAYLLRVKRVRPESILVCCFNHKAAIELRRRLRDLVGADAHGVTVQTYHGLALRILGRACSGMSEGELTGDHFDQMIKDAAAILKGEKPVPGLDADEVRDRLLAGYEHVLVDEYQDIDEPQYELISAIAGRKEQDEDRKFTIMAVGDDDQNIYTFRGANVGFIRRFEADYMADKTYLVENYRSTRYIIEAGNRVIERNQDRMKTDHPIRIDEGRALMPAGGLFGDADPLTRGRVSLVEVADGASQAEAVMVEIKRLQSLGVKRLEDIAVLTRYRQDLAMVRGLAEQAGLPVQWPLDHSKVPPLHRMREIWKVLQGLRGRKSEHIKASTLAREVVGPNGGTTNPWHRLVTELMAEWQEMTADAPVAIGEWLDFAYESLAQRRQDERIGEGIRLNTIHGAKGMEYPHVLLCGDVRVPKDSATEEEERRIFYVGMTRARETLAIIKRRDLGPSLAAELNGSCFAHRRHTEKASQFAGARAYSWLGLEDLYMDYLGIWSPQDKAAKALGSLTPGALLSFESTGAKLRVLTSSGVTVAQLSEKAYAEWTPRLSRVRDIRYMGSYTRLRSDVSNPEYAARIIADDWEVPLCEVVTD